MAVSKRLRFEVLRRDSYTCRYCGASAPDVKIVVDHVIATALGGSDDPSNLVAACFDCNSGKSATPVDAATVADVSEKALHWSIAMEMAANRRADSESQKRARNERFETEWILAAPHQFSSTQLPIDWRSSLDQFARAGLSDRDMIELIPRAMGAATANKWKYFCGCCWTVARELREQAQELVELISTMGDE
ncbi:HNH endonuclease [Rhodococcus sp. BH5]|uniref:HNH endonuclease n=1 Tax=Rhodococcus sp. BH5 TaxID=2871702 RepID=UPI0022CD9298|nr:HNH endonuclease [Rhodococcus sp. BH5]MCZ9631334.1 HNH endonuclease [Rhodococcus sp. BH5]